MTVVSMSTNVEYLGEPEEGRHRLTIIGEATKDAWAAAGVALTERTRDHRLWSAWRASAFLEVVAFEVKSDRLVAYLAGSIAEWRALASVPMCSPAIAAAVRALESRGGRVDRVTCETRELQEATHDQIIGSAKWPWPVHGGAVTVRTVRPIGKISPVQMDFLATALRAGVHSVADRYDEGRSVAVVEGDRVRLADWVPGSACLQLVRIWAQVCWVELEGVELGDR